LSRWGGAPPAARLPAGSIGQVRFAMQPVGHVVGGRAEAVDDHWAAERAIIRLDPDRFTADALLGLDQFSHLEVVFVFDRVTEDKIEYGAGHPRNNPDWPLAGVFAQRGKNRPNRIGVSRCELIGVDGLDVHVTGLDAIDGTPVLDIKPYLAEFGPRGAIRQPAWSAELMAEYY
jgi:tRNA (adenine37-N6)-methyltransferase